MIHVHAIDHVVFRTNNLKAMISFYVDVLGCHVERELPKESGLVQLRAGNALIDLVRFDSILDKVGADSPSQNGRNVDHICLQIQPIDKRQLIGFLIRHGIEYSKFEQRYGAEGFGESLYIDDPEGDTIELKPIKHVE
ncbi:VOC family protein [Vibrio rumoiensis]|uniref:Lactoylglutathione lyase n=1 Tax=Vibrio rumoiensis 1S-45 TaxID=1188252 RepID=A0A1E5E0U5_9VIBR|nr:VOC family protein [Vibrio rumoiensis]OEF24098.1 lactoylglutathione lyase [Vibrio rumoiensis 1S-45]